MSCEFFVLLQKKIIRIMIFFPYLAHTAPIFIDLAILPLNKICIDRIGITMFKVEFELLPKSVTQMFTKIKIFIHKTPEIEIASKFSINVSLSQFKATLKNYLHNLVVYTYSK